ncbi:acyl-CoA thioesterase [Rhodopirellula sallentina]|uniref:Thioesterase superfamily protein n=1 Tax=Rhodopirellula sallentina SM41 TaxID=1263870 RepID=M5UKH1_9BACT|nr:thioesterase family protein [Rhodopirellula sallentina]EMI58351.1 thioesterase superfamily protein [Rhodopirellula sallentina SM41]
MSESPARYRTQRRVEFRDTDAAGIVHFSAFFPIMESVEHEFLRSIGVIVMPSHDNPDSLTWPRVSAGCEYLGPARFEDVLDVSLFVDRVGTSSVHYRYQIDCAEKPVAVGKISVVCCQLGSGGKLVKKPVPDTIRTALLARD